MMFIYDSTYRYNNDYENLHFECNTIKHESLQVMIEKQRFER